jgi:iron complex outermembrane receptor protein
MSLLLRQAAVAHRTLLGYVFDVTTKEPVVGATIRTTEDNTGTATNNSGYFLKYWITLDFYR